MNIPLGLFPPFVYFLNRKKIFLNLLDLGTPFNIKYFWNLGSLLGMFLGVQLFSGILLRMFYNNSVEMAFFSVKLIIQKEVFAGWIIHKIHRRGSSFFFLFLYLHLFRGLYYGGFKQVKIWLRGVRILVLAMAIAFLGYVLPWGQMSF